MYKTSTAVVAFLVTLSAFGQMAPYAGQQQREIKSLSAADVADLLAGQGMGLAKAAELNGYPGPAHVLENAESLALTHAQRQSTKMLLDLHKAQARQIGSKLVTAERALDHAFRNRQIDSASLSRLTTEIGRLQAQLREEHLRTHIEQTDGLTHEQLQRYAVLRGYRTSGSPEGAGPAPSGKHHN